MNNYTLIPEYQVVIQQPLVTVKEVQLGTVPLTPREILFKMLQNMDKEFSEMTAILKTRDKAVWQKSH
jgi:hypothetical protein